MHGSLASSRNRAASAGTSSCGKVNPVVPESIIPETVGSSVTIMASFEAMNSRIERLKPTSPLEA